MPGNSHIFQFALAATLGAGFMGPFKSAGTQVQKLSGSMRKMAEDTDKLRYEKLLKTKQTVKGLDKELLTAESDLKKLRLEAEKSETVSKSQAAAIRRLENRVEGLKTKRRDQLVVLREINKEMRESGQTVASLARNHAILTAQTERYKKQVEKLAGIQAKQRKIAEKRAGFRGQIFEMTALGAAIALPIRKSIQFESAMADVRKVVDFETPTQFAQMQRDILKLTTTGGIPLAADQISQIVAAAGQAGIARQDLMVFAQDAAKMAVAFDQSAEESGSAMAGMRSIFKLNQGEVRLLGDAYNFLSNRMDARARDMLNISQRAGSMGRQFGLTGTQLGALSATFLALKTPPEIASTAISALLNKLVNAPKQGKVFQNALASIGMDATELKDKIKDDAQGALLEFLDAVKGAEDVEGVLFDIGGLEYSKHFVKLVGGLDMYRKALDDVSDSTKYAGSMQTEFEVRSKTTENALQIAGNRMNRIGINITSGLLPPFNSLLSIVGVFGDSIAWISETFPGFSKVVGIATFGLIGLRLAVLGGGYAFTFMQGGLLSLQKSYVIFKGLLFSTRAQMIATTIATHAWAAAQWVLNVAMSANPIGLIIAGAVALAAVGVAVWKNWEPIGAFFGRLWSGIKSTFLGFIDWIRNLSLYKVGINLIRSFGSGIWSVATLPGRIVKDVFSKVRNFLPFSDAKEGPLSDLTASGRSLVQTFAAGARQGKAAGGMGDVFGGLVPERTAAVGPGRPAGAFGQPINLTVNQTFNLTTGQDETVRNQVVAAGKLSAVEFKKLLEDYFNRENRLAFA